MWASLAIFSFFFLLMAVPVTSSTDCDASYNEGPDKCPAGCAYEGEAEDSVTWSVENYSCELTETQVCSCCDQSGLACSNGDWPTCWGGSGAASWNK